MVGAARWVLSVTAGAVVLAGAAPAPVGAVASAAREPAAQEFVPVAPERLLDTREATRTGYAGGKPGAGETVEVQVAGSGAAQVPADARAVVLNVTGAQPTGSGYVTAWPCGTGRPTASALNLAAGVNAANLVVTGLGAGGRVCLFTSAGTHLVADLSGWFPASSTVVPVAPERLLDTREDTRTGYEGGKPGPGAVVELQVAGAGAADVPGDAAAVVLDVAGTRPTGPGFVTVWPCGLPRPTASTLNLTDAATRANLVVAGLGVGGRVCLYTAAGADLVADLTAWFPASSRVVPVAPERLLDTREDTRTGYDGAKPAPGDTVQVQVAGAGAARVPADAAAVVATVTGVAATGPGYVTAWACGAQRPTASTLNLVAGGTRPNLVVTGLGEGGRLCLYTSAGAHLLVDVVGYVEGAGPRADLRRWYAALAARGSAQANLLVLGDSVLEGQGVADPGVRFPDRLRVALRGRFDGGAAAGVSGYRPARFGAASLPDPPTTGDVEPITAGLGGRTYRLSPGATVTVAGTGDVARVWYLATDFFAGMLTVRVDGAERLSDYFVYDPDHGTYPASVDVPTGHAEPAEVAVEVRSSHPTSSVFVSGVEFLAAPASPGGGDAGRGVHVYDGSHAGWTADWHDTESVLDADAAVGPGLVVVALGYNDAGWGYTPTQYAEHLRALVVGLRERTALDPAFLLVGLPRPGPCSPGWAFPWSAYLAELAVIAADDPGVGFLDAGARFPPHDDETSGLWADCVHLSAAGQEALAGVVADAVSP